MRCDVLTRDEWDVSVIRQRMVEVVLQCLLVILYSRRAEKSAKQTIVQVGCLVFEKVIPKIMRWWFSSSSYFCSHLWESQARYFFRRHDPHLVIECYSHTWLPFTNHVSSVLVTHKSGWEHAGSCCPSVSSVFNARVPSLVGCQTQQVSPCPLFLFCKRA